MTQRAEIERLVEQAIEPMLKNLRDRRLLKYLFEADPDNVCAYGHVDRPFDVEVQREICATLARIALEDSGLIKREEERVEAAYREGWHDGHSNGEIGGFLGNVNSDWDDSDSLAALNPKTEGE